MNFGYIIFLAAGALINYSASADTKSALLKGYCRDNDDAAVVRIQDSLRYFNQRLPRVPPEEESYLASEDESVRAIFNQETLRGGKPSPITTQRFARLTERRLYYVWETRRALPDAIASVDAVFNPTKVQRLWLDGKTRVQPFPGAANYELEDANQLSSMARAIGYLNTLQFSLDELLLREQSHEDNPLLTTKVSGELVVRNRLLLSDLSSFVQCKLARISQTKP